MRTRFLALFILSSFVCIPIGIYWYFFSQNTSSLTISMDSDTGFSVRLEGSLESTTLPLLDNLLLIQKECISSCIISPIAPLKYNLSITSSGKTSIQENIIIELGENKILNYSLLDEIIFEKIEYIKSISNDVVNLMLDNARVNTSQVQYSLVGIDHKNNLYVERNTVGRRELGILTMENFFPIYTIPNGLGAFTIDKTGLYFLASVGDRGTFIISLDTRFQKEIPVKNITGYVRLGREEKVYTDSGVLMYSGGKYASNIRFTDFIDISKNKRLGYIDRDDTEKLSLSNLPVGQSVLVSIDRLSGESTIIKRGIDISLLFYIDNDSVFMDQFGSIWKIIL